MRRWRAAAALLGLVVAGQAHVSGPWSRTGTYVVRRGESLSLVARRIGVPVRDLARVNKISNPHYVRRGRVLVIPPERRRPARAARRGRARVRVQPPVPSPVVVYGGGRRYRVRRGDSLAVVAARHGTTVRALMRANGLRSSRSLPVGRSLRIPSGGWTCPVRGRVDFADGWNHLRAGGRRHVGTDLFAFRGTPVVANVSGVLEYSSGSRAGLGYRLRGDDGNTYYGAHLHSLVSRPGRIARGAVIGTVGSTGNARGTTPHLHFEIRPGGGGPVNPVHTLRRWC
ncbi:MAG: M23 family metallopeptidase [Actinomycetota bacterium]|nr:M23 family metallopeptidase [Actinomycetota bacterium]